MQQRIGIIGATGRMGKMLIKSIIEENSSSCILTAALTTPGNIFLHMDAGELVSSKRIGVSLSSNLRESVDEFDVLIDFTSSEAILDNLKICHENNKSMVIGTTGLDTYQKEKLLEASKEIPIVISSNFSIGANFLFYLLRISSKIIGKGSDIEITETHHREKKDVPSGTSLRMGEVICKALGYDLEDVAIYDRRRKIKTKSLNSIGFTSIRAGDIIGEHTALFALSGERIDISHKVSDRMIFAKGAVRAALWIKGRKSALYDMQDVLELQ